MKTIKTLLLSMILLLIALPLQAQTATTQTILSSAVSSTTATTFSLASVTGCSASTQTQEYDLWVDGEFAKIQAQNSTALTVTVTRGYRNTAATTHATSSVVFCGPAGGGTPFITGDAVTGRAYGNFIPNATCTATQYTYLPLISIKDGTLWNCLPAASSSIGGQTTTSGRSIWVKYGFQQWAQGHPVTNLNDAAYTATLADEFINFNALSTGRTVTLPSITGVPGKTIVIRNTSAGSSTITIATSNAQPMGTAGTTSITMSGYGAVTRLISFVTFTGGWGWGTW